MVKAIRRWLLAFSLIAVAGVQALHAGQLLSNEKPQATAHAQDEVIFAYGGDLNRPFINYVASLTRKPRAKICFLPTGLADSPWAINWWYSLCAELPVEPHVLNVWVSSAYAKESFEHDLLGMDAIIVGGGNTLNMIAIWKAQGIDLALRKALQRGIVLAGGSAGSICWYQGGISDSRPIKLSLVGGLGFLSFSHCPHYSEDAPRKALYHELIRTHAIDSGYASDAKSGILFVNGKFTKSISLDSTSHSYFVFERDGKIVESQLPSEIIH